MPKTRKPLVPSDADSPRVGQRELRRASFEPSAVDSHHESAIGDIAANALAVEADVSADGSVVSHAW